MPRKRQKLRHRNTPLSEAFIAEDTAYMPPASLRDTSCQTTHPEKSASKEIARRKVPRPRNHNRRDPFHTLGDDEVNLIIALLPAEDTETLRRVSKLWKASSEYHCGKTALVTHFPWALAKIDRCETREAANLLFRRCLYYQKSLEAGYATRAIRCDEASDWDLHDNWLLWRQVARWGETDKEGLSIRELRTADDKSIIESNSVDLDTSYPSHGNTRMLYVQIVPGGDFLTTTTISKDRVKEIHRVRRISAQGDALWSIDLGENMMRPVIGKESVYFVHGSGLYSYDWAYKLSFAKYRLCDGSMVFDALMPKEQLTYQRIHHFMFEALLVLSGNERLAAFGSESRSGVDIFSPMTGQFLKRFDRPDSDPLKPDLDFRFLSSHMAGVWIKFGSTVKLITCGESNNSSSESEHCYLQENDFRSIAFNDGNHNVFLRVLHADWDESAYGARGNELTNPFAQIAIGPNLVTLPGRSRRDGKRREFELELPWIQDGDDFFGMKNDYLVYHSAEEEFLVLIDFWPVW